MREDDIEIYEPSKKKHKEGVRWPPPFEASDVCYIFDPRSGLFYEGETDFFYDPKTKLYYGNKQKKYFELVPGEKPLYREVSQRKHTTSQETSVLVGTEKNDGSIGDQCQNDYTKFSEPIEADDTNKNEKKKIAICLKTKPGTFISKIALPTAPAQPLDIVRNIDNSTKTNPIESSHNKKHKKDMEKWLQRDKKIEDDNEDPAMARLNCESSTIQVNPLTSSKDICTNATMTSKVVGTIKGKPVCLLCKRKFETIEKLKQHIQLSALHKQNLEKKRKLEELEKGQAAGYRDRARERRGLYGSDYSTGTNISEDQNIVNGPSLTKARSVAATETVNPDQCLGDTNVGNKLLQKLGWNGGLLGRDSNRNGDGNSSQRNVSEKLKQDWKRIESMAGGKRSV